MEVTVRKVAMTPVELLNEFVRVEGSKGLR